MSVMKGGWLAVLGLMSLGRLVQAQEVAGTVMDVRTGRQIEGAQVTVLGTQNATRTDARGRFRLTGLTGQSVTLTINMIGYRPTSEVVAVGQMELRINLSEQVVNLGELVVTGTPEAAQKRSLGNSVATVSAADQMQLAPVPDVSNLINSRAPGVVVIPGTGQVGSGPRIRIRGVNSFSLNAEPLIYIDGARVVNDVATGISVQGFGSGIASRLNDLNPNEIENIEIIKGPAAATLYGTEATNGVIQIITKRGKAGPKPVIEATVRQGTQWFMDAEGRIVKPVNKDASGNLVTFDPVAQEKARGTPLFRNGYGAGYTLALSGGNPGVRYRLGSTWDRDDGIEPTNNLRRFTFNGNVVVTGNEKFDVQSTLGFVKSKVNQAFEAGAGGIWFSTIFGDPLDINTPTRGFLFGPPEFQWGAFQASQEVNRFTSSVTLNHRPLPWLSQRLTVGLDQTDEASIELDRFLPPEWVQFSPGDDALGFKFQQRRSIAYYTADYSATARNQLRKDLHSSFSVGAQFYRRRTDIVQASGAKFAAPGLETVLATAQPTGLDDFIENTTLGVFAQEQLGWKERLYLTGAVRVDNNSAFGKDFNLVVYPKISASYVLKENASGRFNSVKLRAAYGQAGQQPEAFAALRTYQPVTGGDGGPALIPQFVGNPNLKPERGIEYELGLDGGFFDDRISVELTAFYKKTRDAILLKPLPPSLGFPGNQFLNVGAIRNQGVELQLVGRPVTSRDLNVDLRLSLATNANKVLDLGPGVTELAATGPKVGDPVDAVYRRRAKRAELDANGRAINVVCEAARGGGDAPCTASDRPLLGRFDPSLEGAFTSTVTWKRLRFYGLVDFKHGNRHIDNNLRALCQVFLRCRENFFPQEFPATRIAEIQSAGTVTSFTVNDASFAKLRELSVGYQLPRHLARWVGASEATATLTGRNLHTWTAWTGLDPEAYFVTQQFVRLEQDQTPQLASFTATLRLTF